MKTTRLPVLPVFALALLLLLPVPPALAAGPAAPAPSATLPEDVRADMNVLVERLARVAAEGVMRAGTFRPFGGVLNPDKTVGMSYWNAKDQVAPSDKVILEEIFRHVKKTVAESPAVMAAAIASPMSVPREGGGTVSGIRVEVDHRRGEPRIVFIPYVVNDGKFSLLEPVYSTGRNAMFDHGATGGR